MSKNIYTMVQDLDALDFSKTRSQTNNMNVVDNEQAPAGVSRVCVNSPSEAQTTPVLADSIADEATQQSQKHQRAKATDLGPLQNEWCGVTLPDTFTYKQLGIYVHNEDRLLSSREINRTGRSLAQQILLDHCQKLQNESCRLSGELMSSNYKFFFNKESNIWCARRFAIYCSNKVKGVTRACSYRAIYTYKESQTQTEWYNEESSVPALIIHQKCFLHHDTCCQAQVEVSRRGVCNWPENRLDIARELLTNGMNLKRIVSWGFNTAPSLVSFSARQLYKAMYSRYMKEEEKGHQRLLEYFNSRTDSGENAYFAMEGLDTGNPLIWWQTLEQATICKLGWATTASIDFVYKLFKSWTGKNMAFGHFTILSPSNCLVTISQFIVPRESCASMRWIQEHFHTANKGLGINIEPSVSSDSYLLL